MGYTLIEQLVHWEVMHCNKVIILRDIALLDCFDNDLKNNTIIIMIIII